MSVTVMRPACENAPTTEALSWIGTHRAWLDSERRWLNAYEAATVQQARALSMSWATIAGYLGRSTPTVWAKHREEVA